MTPTPPPPPDLSTAPDQDVVTLALQGREDGFRELLRRYQPRVYDLIYRIVRQHDLAEDLTQETFITAFGALHTHRPESKFSAWLLRIGNNAALKHIRRKEVDAVPLGDAPDATPPRRARLSGFQVAARTNSTPGRLDRFRMALEQGLASLKPKYRLCFTLRHVEGREYAEIAEIMSLSEDNVRAVTLRARKKLQQILESLLDDPRSRSATPA